MHKAKIHKAQGIGKQEVESLIVEFSEEIPYPVSIEGSEKLFRDDGRTLEFLLYHALPGGTYDRLLIAMLQRRTSQLIVSYGGLTTDAD